ncbi:hypothetical protein BYT27DRAFT_7252263 [Phlegmacium glaucopus]|nr:hypothetical protein BYT27DRAFT_7252263 [Phlegmacium glaucopus]
MSEILEDGNQISLEIPIDITSAVCLNPRKYLRYLGWCILGLHTYIVPVNDPLAHAVDIEVIKQRPQTGLDGGMHIIPYQRGDEWLQLIIDNRPHLENLESLSINDIRNGVYADDDLHNHYFDPRDVVVLKMPNPIPETTDVPDRAQRLDLDPSCSFPETSRYTLQWIVSPTRPAIRNIYQITTTPPPYTTIYLSLPTFCYIITTALQRVQQGSNTIVMLPKRAVDSTSQKRQPAGKDRGSSDGAAVDSEIQDSWHEDDVILFFWGNSKVARERVAHEEQERKGFTEEWRATVTQSRPHFSNIHVSGSRPPETSSTDSGAPGQLPPSVANGIWKSSSALGAMVVGSIFVVVTVAICIVILAAFGGEWLESRRCVSGSRPGIDKWSLQTLRWGLRCAKHFASHVIPSK